MSKLCRDKLRNDKIMQRVIKVKNKQVKQWLSWKMSKWSSKQIKNWANEVESKLSIEKVKRSVN